MKLNKVLLLILEFSLKLEAYNYIPLQGSPVPVGQRLWYIKINKYSIKNEKNLLL